MSGHSKWSNIKRKKAVLDEKKGKIFSKLSRAVTVAAREGGGDPDMNPSLRLAVDKAKEASMPKENIDRAIKKGTGDLEGEDYIEAIYEGYGEGGVAFLVKSLTDNKNRTVSEIRNIFSRYGGSMGGAGSTSYIFAEDPENPSFTIPVNSQAMVRKVIDLYEALEDHDDVQEVYANFDIPEGMMEDL